MINAGDIYAEHIVVYSEESLVKSVIKKLETELQ